MKKFLYKSALFFVIIVSISFTIDEFITTGLKRSQSFHFVDWNNIYNGNINADIIINGSSKAWHHISPKILDSLTNLESYNIGIDGYDFVMQKAKLDVYLNHNSSPDIIIQIVGNNTLKLRKNLFQKKQFAPYIGDSIIKNATLKYPGFDFFDYNIPLLRYSSDFSLVVDGFISLMGFSEILKDKNKYKGYEAYNKAWDGSFAAFKKQYPEGRTYVLNENSVKLFDEYLQDMTARNIKVFLVYSPTYIESQIYVNNRDEIIDRYKHFSQKYNIPFLDYSNNSIAKNKKYFYNSQHLNKLGAELFTVILANDINNLTKHN